MSLLSLFTFVVFAAESLISPLPDDGIVTPTIVPKPHISFGQLALQPSFGQVLGVSTEATPTPTASNAALPPLPHKKSHYVIAVLGDSMVDTLGPGVPHLKAALSKIYPGVSFDLFNYGVGGTNIDYGIERLSNDYSYLGSPVPSLLSRRPDIVVVESFGYNPYPFDDGAIDKHWLQLARIIDIFKAELPGTNVVIAATIAPDAKTFGDGAPATAFGPEDKRKRTNTIKQYLDSTVKFAKSQHLPLADLYHASLDQDGNGKEEYINAGDHIHYSDAGRELFARTIAEAIVDNRLLE